MTPPRPLPLIIRLFLRCLPLGDRREEAASDVAELFHVRRAEQGRARAYWRLVRDLASVAASPRSTSGSPSPAVRLAGLRSWLLDLRYGLRLFRKHPGVIGATVGGLALAIAVGTSVFTILNASILRSYGMDDPTSVVRVQMRFTGGISTDWPYHAFVGLREGARQSAVAASVQESVRVSVAAGESPLRMDTLFLVSDRYMAILGGRALVGRTLLPVDDEPGAAPVVVVNHRFWTTRLGADRGVVGKTIWLSGSAVTVVGVIDPSFTGPVDSPPALWATFGSYGAIYQDRPINRSSATEVSVVARLEPGVTPGHAERELSAIAAALPDVGIRTESGRVIPAVGVRLDGAASPMDGPDSLTGMVIVGAILLIVGLVLALACANVANLLLAGTAARGRELGVRLALGASPGRIRRQLVGESLLIGAMAGIAGFVLSIVLMPVVARAVGLSDTVDLSPDVRVVLFAAGAAMLSGLLAGLAPAKHGSRGDLVSALKQQATQPGPPHKTARTRRLFVGFQAAASTLLLVTAALFLRAALHIVHVDLGFDANRLAAVAPAFPRSGFDQPAVEAYWRAALERVRAIRSVEQAALTSSVPLGNEVTVREVSARAQAGVPYRIFENRTGSEYFTTAGLQLLRGRSYSAGEALANAPVAVVSESLAADFFSGAEPLGASLSVVSEDLRSLHVIGVVREAITTRVRGRGNGAIYRPLPASELATARLVVRSMHPELIARDLEKSLLSVDARVRPGVTLVSENVDRYMNEPKILAGLSGAIAALAVVLAVLGLYGVTMFVVSQRLWEMQVRQAIGASTGDIVRLLTRQSLAPVVVGLTVGLAIMLPAAGVLTPALSGLSPYDPPAIAGAVALLLMAALAAVLSPAWRAAHTDAASVLRQ